MFFNCKFFLAVIKPVEKKVDEGKEAAIEAEVRAARERALVPLEIRVKSFKEMLKEKDVSFFYLSKVSPILGDRPEVWAVAQF